MPIEATSDRSSFRAPWMIFWAGFIVRVLYITIAHTYKIRVFQDHFQFGWEMGRIARALANGRGYADPFVGLSGPTAWCPPIYPLLLGGVFKLFGVYTALSGWIILTLNSVFSALTAIFVYEIAARSFDRRVALWSAWLWALYPAAMQYAVHWVWDMAITACVFSLILVLALRVRGVGESSFPAGRQLTGLWASFGLLWGAVALLNPSLLTFLPACGIWMLWDRRRPILPGLARAVLAAVLCAACIAPWIIRNWETFHAFIPMRPNLGCELYASSLESNNGFPWGAAVAVYPATPDMQQYRRQGEVAFCKERGVRAKEIFAANPGRFRNYTYKRIWFFWAGVPHPVEKSFMTELFREINYSFLSVGGLFGLALALRRRRPGAMLYLMAFFLLPLAYYAVTVQARFRHPLEPLIAILTVYLFQSADRTRAFSWQPKPDQ